MPLTKPIRSLYTPEGEVSLQEKDVIPINRRTLQVLAWLHEWAFNQQINIFCKRCEQPIRGQNNDANPQDTPAVACQCREWRYDGKG